MTGLAYWAWAIALAALAGLIVALAMRPLIAWLKRRAVWDVPNARSSHAEATPRGGGIAVMAGIVAAAAVWLGLLQDAVAAVALLGALALAAISWLDDRRAGGLPARLRLAAQALVIGIVLALLPAEARIAGGWMPLWLERIVCFFAWLWFTNLFNFMDGINGISGTEMASIGIGIAALHAIAGDADSSGGLALILAAAGLGFLPWNWNRARVFLGDVGSVPAGFLLGWLLLDAALQGQWAAALIVPMYYWLDASITLLRRLLRREKIWEAHRSHFYQQAARRFGDHVSVTRRIAALNVALIGLALVSSAGWPLNGLAVTVAAGLTILLCRHFAQPAKPVL
ncbi:MAG TPA: glycosyltransferase family 4 protein [Ferrovibrio sp.]|uniref:MraY family glycosyltransferase n=1 Tax=Ferrovibrio sp. TaxID=1917215 RepID=UPI002ED431FA